MRRVSPVVLAVVPALVAALLLAACGDGGPKDREFSIDYVSGQASDRVFKAKQGDRVTIKVKSDSEGEVHLHGYDIEADIEAGQLVVITFEARVTGRFLIEEEHTETVMAYLEIEPR